MTDKQQQDEAKALAKANAEAVEIAEAQPEGGRYLAEDGKTLVNANGEPIKGGK